MDLRFDFEAVLWKDVGRCICIRALSTKSLILDEGARRLLRGPDSHACGSSRRFLISD